MSKDNKMSDRDPYLYSGTDVLKNKFGVKDNKKLSKLEDYFYKKASRDNIKGIFDSKHFQKIHKELFGKVYDWAGEIRTVNTSKREVLYAKVDRIEPELNKTLTKLQNEDWYCLDKDKFADKAGKYFSDIDAAHPFREGNTRTMQVFFNALAKQSNLYIDWGDMNRKDYIQARIEGIVGSDSSIKSLIKSNIKDLNIKNTLNQESMKNNEKDFYQRETKKNVNKNKQGRGQTF